MSDRLGALQFSGISWAMAEFHKGEKRSAAKLRRDNARKRSESRQLQRMAKLQARAAQ